MMMTPRHFPGEKRVKRLVLLALVLTGVSIAAPARGDYAAAVLADNPAAYWRMNESVGAVAANDSSGNGGSGVYHNGVTLGVSGGLVEDPSNTASEYDGVNDGSGSAVGGSTDHFFGSPASLGSDYSVEFWFRNARPITGPGHSPSPVTSSAAAAAPPASTTPSASGARPASPSADSTCSTARRSSKT